MNNALIDGRINHFYSFASEHDLTYKIPTENIFEGFVTLKSGKQVFI